MLPLTPPQTVGPFFAILVPERGTLTLASSDASGPRAAVEGSVRDGVGHPVPDALIEVWQANADGHFHHPEDPASPGPQTGFDGFGRIHADADGAFAIETIMPGSVPGPENTPQAPHLVVGLFARGLLTRLVTRIYFENDPLNADDPILTMLPADRRSTLIATELAPGRYQFDVVLQGPGETVFFDV